MYIVGTIAVLMLVPAEDVSPTSGVFHAVTLGSTVLGVAFLGIVAALLVSVGNAGGVGSTVAGIARVPFIVGIDRYLPAAFGKIHPKWRTPWVSILVQAVISGAILLVSQISETVHGAYQALVDITIIIYFIPFLYMFAAVIKLANRPDRLTNPNAVLIPGGKIGVWLAAGVGLVVVFAAMLISAVPPGDSANKFLFEVKLLVGTIGAILLGLVLYWRGARAKRMEKVGN
jgi:amino acid transporter